MTIYLGGSLKNGEGVQRVAAQLREAGHEVFDEWVTPGPDADDFLWSYGKARGLNAKQTLETYAAKHVFEFDKHHLDRADAMVLVMPAGKSAFLELGYMLGRGKPGYILMTEDPERIDVMFQFATGIALSTGELIDMLRRS